MTDDLAGEDDVPTEARPRDMSKRLYYSSTHIIFLSLILTELTNLPINSFDLTGGDGLSTISIPEITAQSDGDNMISHSIIDEVHSDNLEKTVRDLASFLYTSHRIRIHRRCSILISRETPKYLW